MGIAELIIAILDLVGKVVPQVSKWLGRKTNGYSVWKSELTYWAARPRSIGRRFVGRDAELKATTDAFRHGNHVALTGGPGTGKSQLAAEFVQKSKRKGFWVSGGETPIQTIVALAPHLGIEREGRNVDELLFQVRRRLQALPNKTLWVIDNLADLDQLNGLLNEIGKVTLLVTSQDSREGVLPAGIVFQPIGVLDPEAAVRILCRNDRHDSRQPVFRDLVDEVGCLPRAVEALAMQLSSPNENPARLLEKLRESPNPLQFDRFQMQTAGLQIPQTESLFNALRRPVDALEPDTRAALAHLGYTADLPIPMPLALALTGLDGGAIVNFFDKCARRSVLSVSGNEITLHSLTKALIAAISPARALRITLERATRRLAEIDESGYPPPPDEFPHYEQLSRWTYTHIDQEDLALISFSNNLAIHYSKIGHYDDAARIYAANLEVEERVFGPEHPNTLNSLNNLASNLSQAGRFLEAAQLHRQTLEVQEKVLGPDHPSTILSRSNLGADYANSGQFNEAILILDLTLESRNRVLGPDHPDTLGNCSYLAATYSQCARYNDAVPLLKKTIERQNQILGPDHPDSLVSRNNLAATYGQAGYYEEALLIMRETVEARERILGFEHPDTLTSLNNLANAFTSARRFDDAFKLNQRVLEARERLFGTEHPDTLASRNNLAYVYRALGRDADADALFD